MNSPNPRPWFAAPNKRFKSFASLSGTGRAGPLTKRQVPMLIRIIVVALCYSLSSFAFSMSFIYFAGNAPFKSLGIILIYTWLSHFVMCIYWVRQVKPHRFWPVSYSIAGAISLIFMPFGFVVAFPCVLLGIHIARWYYLNHVSNESQISLPTEQHLTSGSNRSLRSLGLRAAAP